MLDVHQAVRKKCILSITRFSSMSMDCVHARTHKHSHVTILVPGHYKRYQRLIDKITQCVCVCVLCVCVYHCVYVCCVCVLCACVCVLGNGCVCGGEGGEGVFTISYVCAHMCAHLCAHTYMCTLHPHVRASPTNQTLMSLINTPLREAGLGSTLKPPCCLKVNIL